MSDSGLLGPSFVISLHRERGVPAFSVPPNTAKQLAESLATGSFAFSFEDGYPGGIAPGFTWPDMTADLMPAVRQLAASHHGTLLLGPGLLDQLHAEMLDLALMSQGQAGQQGQFELLLLPALSDVTTLTVAVEMDPFAASELPLQDIARGGLAAAQEAQYLPHLSSIIIDLSDNDYSIIHNSFLKAHGMILVRHPSLAIQLWPPPSVAELETLRARALEAPDAGVEEEGREKRGRWWRGAWDADDPLQLTAAERQALLALLLTWKLKLKLKLECGLRVQCRDVTGSCQVQPRQSYGHLVVTGLSLGQQALGVLHGHDMSCHHLRAQSFQAMCTMDVHAGHGSIDAHQVV